MSLVAVAGPAMGEEAREATATYVGGTGQPVPGAYLVSGGQDVGEHEVGDYHVSGEPLVVGANSVAFDVHDGEAQVAVSIEDTTATVGEERPICGHYTVYGEEDSLGNGVFTDETTISLPSEADHVTISVGHSHDPGMLGLGLTDCAEQKGTAGQVHATFT